MTERKHLATVGVMRSAGFRLVILLVLLGCFPNTAPAPLVYTPGEGWTYEPIGEEGSWKRDRAMDQLVVAKEAFDAGKFRTALKAAKRVVKQWPLSDYAAEAQYLMGRSREARKQDQKAFKEYQELIERFPRYEKYDEVLERQYEIANRFLGGQWFKLWGYIPFFPSMEKTVDMYESLIKSGPYSDVAPQAQMNIGAAWEKKKDFTLAAKAYEKAADRYNDREGVAADALFKAAKAYQRQAKTAEYDQGVAEDAIDVYSDFVVLFPDDGRVEESRTAIETLRLEQARGSYQIARFYEKKKKWDGAVIYYNEVLLKDPNSEFADQARERIARIKEKHPAKETENSKS